MFTEYYSDYVPSESDQSEYEYLDEDERREMDRRMKEQSEESYKRYSALGSLKGKLSTPKLVDYSDTESEQDKESLDSNLSSNAFECKTNEQQVPEMEVSQMTEGTSEMEAQPDIFIHHNAIEDPNDLSENKDFCNDTIPGTETSDNEDSFNETIPETECSDNDDLLNTTIPESETEDLLDQETIPESESNEYDNTTTEDFRPLLVPMTLTNLNESPNDFNESKQSMDESSECETTADEDPTDLSKPSQRPDPTDRLTFKDKCPTDIRKLVNQIPRRYDTKMLDARLLSNAPQERKNDDTELTKQFYSSSDRPSQEGSETKQQTKANSMNDVHQLEKQFKSSSDYPSMINQMINSIHSSI